MVGDGRAKMQANCSMFGNASPGRGCKYEPRKKLVIRDLEELISTSPKRLEIKAQNEDVNISSGRGWKKFSEETESRSPGGDYKG